MKNIIKASLYKLVKDQTFIVTLIVGIVLAIAMPLLYGAINKNASQTIIGSGSYMLVSSFNPTQNFGLAIPINLIILVVGEFNFGTIRNKVIVGYKKSSIYFSIFVTGLIFTVIMILSYAALSTLFGYFINGGWGKMNGGDAGKFILCGVCGFIFVTSLTIFFSTLIRSQGPAIGLTLFILIGCMIGAVAQFSTGLANESEQGILISTWVNPLFVESILSIGTTIESEAISKLLSGKYLAGSICSPIIYTIIFYIIGAYLFKRRDLK